MTRYLFPLGLITLISSCAPALVPLSPNPMKWEDVYDPGRQMNLKTIQQGNSYTVEEMDAEGNLMMRAQARSVNPLIKHGLAEYFDRSSNLLARGHYNNGFLDSTWVVLTDTLNYSSVLKNYFSPRIIDWSDTSNQAYVIAEDMPWFDYNFEPSTAIVDSLRSEFRSDIQRLLSRGISESNHADYVDAHQKLKAVEKAIFNEYVEKAIRYPIRAIHNGKHGTVYLEAVIDESGDITDIKVIKGVDRDLDFEAIRILQDAPLWNPGRQKGEPVSVVYTFQIEFTLP